MTLRLVLKPTLQSLPLGDGVTLAFWFKSSRPIPGQRLAIEAGRILRATLSKQQMIEALQIFGVFSGDLLEPLEHLFSYFAFAFLAHVFQPNIFQRSFCIIPGFFLFRGRF